MEIHGTTTSTATATITQSWLHVHEPDFSLKLQDIEDFNRKLCSRVPAGGDKLCPLGDATDLFLRTWESYWVRRVSYNEEFVSTVFDSRKENSKIICFVGSKYVKGPFHNTLESKLLYQHTCILVASFLALVMSLMVVNRILLHLTWYSCCIVKID